MENKEILKNWLLSVRGNVEQEITDDAINPIVEKMDIGTIRIEDEKIIQVLRKPIVKKDVSTGEEIGSIDTLTYRNSFTGGQQNAAFKGIDVSKNPVQAGDALIAMLTSNSKGLIDKLKDIDLTIARNIQALYFLA